MKDLFFRLYLEIKVHDSILFSLITLLPIFSFSFIYFYYILFVCQGVTVESEDNFQDSGLTLCHLDLRIEFR